MPLTPPTAQTVSQGMTQAQASFALTYPGDVYYNVAKPYVQQGINNHNAVEIARGFVVLLINWDTSFYIRQKENQSYSIKDALIHHKRYFSPDYLERIKKMMEDLLKNYDLILMDFSQRSIDGMISDIDEQNIKKIFQKLQDVLGPVGAGMSLSLIGPDFFPSWNNSIAKAYGLNELQKKYNQNKYFKFMKEVKNIKSQLGTNVSLKALDEYNWMTY